MRNRASRRADSPLLTGELNGSLQHSYPAMTLSIRLRLLCPERFDWIDVRRAPCRQIARYHRHEQQQSAHAEERRGIRASDTEQEAREQTREPQRGGHADYDAEAREQQRALEHRANDGSALGA